MADRRLIDDLNRVVVHPPKPRERLPAVGSPGTLPGRGTGTAGSGTGPAGIASPLTEPDYLKREYHADLILSSSDGVFTLELKPLKAIELLDARSQPVRVVYAQPVDPPPPP